MKYVLYICYHCTTVLIVLEAIDYGEAFTLVPPQCNNCSFAPVCPGVRVRTHTTKFQSLVNKNLDAEPVRRR